MKFRNLKDSEIECRVGTLKKDGSGCSILLYKDARCDMNILDETVGSTNWQRKHLRDNANCIVSIWDAEKSQWIEKEDTGTESNTEKEKGLASDSFKRACFNWGIGRELYTAPFIWINLDEKEVSEGYNGNKQVKTRFKVLDIVYKENVITELTISEENGKIRYQFNSNRKEEISKKEATAKAKETAEKVAKEFGSTEVIPPPEKATDEQITQIKNLATLKGASLAKINEHYKIKNLQDICWTDAKHCIDELKKREDKK